jgi:hypothetical protein
VCHATASTHGLSAYRGLVLRLARSALPPFSRGRILSTSADGIRAAYLWYQGAESRAATRILGRRRPTSGGSGSPAPKTASWRRRTMTARTGDDETTGCSDVSLWRSGDLAHVAVQRRTSTPMPPPTPCGGIFFRRLHVPDRGRQRPSAVDRDGHARSRAVPLSGSSDTGGATGGLYGHGAQRQHRQRSGRRHGGAIGAVEVRGATTRGSGTEPSHSGARQVLAERA